MRSYPIRRRLKRWPDPSAAFEPPPPKHTAFSSTVFSGDTEAWVAYLEQPMDRRHDRPEVIRVAWDPDARRIAFVAENEASTHLADLLFHALRTARERARFKGFVSGLLEQMLFANPTNAIVPIHIRVSTTLPSCASREIVVDDDLRATETRIVLQAEQLGRVLQDVQDAGELSDEGLLGVMWPVVRRVIMQLGFSSYPRDRFVERIKLTARVMVVGLNLLFDSVREGRLRPNAAGVAYERYVGRRAGIPIDELYERHPHFRLLHELMFALDERKFRMSRNVVDVLVREFLDDRYLRLNVAGAMPATPEGMTRMPYIWRDDGVMTPVPRLGRHGILQQEDLISWKLLEGPFREQGFTLIRQLGIGEFGRVYEAVNRANSRYPLHVALKVDRVRLGLPNQSILDPDLTMRLSADLAASPHVMRIYDVGRVRNLTYHVMQAIDGETLDVLSDTVGQEHTSVPNPAAPHQRGLEAMRAVHASLEGTNRHSMSRARFASGFRAPLSISQTLDVLTSMGLWLEEVHQLGYVVNDLKNGNVMLSRRGQLKGIDLDFYSKAAGPRDRMPDYFFLSLSLLMFVLNAGSGVYDVDPSPRGLREPADIRRLLEAHWAFGDVAGLSGGRVRTEEVVDLLTTLVRRSRDHTYANEPHAFSEDIDRLIRTKRRILMHEIVLD